jgi:hypothetical protein
MKTELKKGQSFKCKNDDHKILIIEVNKASVRYYIVYPHKVTEQKWPDSPNSFMEPLLRYYILEERYDRRKLKL